ncbi:MAG: hypothetical protein IIU88_00035, partial [Clostridia bacterium]|nr:hypothetical protein [Clostridia bacterium]
GGMRCYAKLHTTMAVFGFKAHASTNTKGTPQGVPFVLTKSKKAMNLANSVRDLPSFFDPSVKICALRVNFVNDMLTRRRTSGIIKGERPRDHISLRRQS